MKRDNNKDELNMNLSKFSNLSFTFFILSFPGTATKTTANPVIRQTRSGYHVSLSTDRCYIRTLSKHDEPLRHLLYRNQKNMSTYEEGVPLSAERIHTSFQSRLKKSKYSPYTAYLIFSKKDPFSLSENIEEGGSFKKEDRTLSEAQVFSRKSFTEKKDFIGEITLGCSLKEPDILEIAYVLRSKFWGQGYGKEMVHNMLCVLKELSRTTPFVEERVFPPKKTKIKKIFATASPENIASWKILESQGFQLKETREQYNGIRRAYYLDLDADSSLK